jgi:hypothetical protein
MGNSTIVVRQNDCRAQNHGRMTNSPLCRAFGKKTHGTNSLCRALHRKRMAKIIFVVRLPQNARQTHAHVHTT